MLRLLPTSIRDAVRPAQLCDALDGLAENGVDAPFVAARGKAAPGTGSEAHVNATMIVMVYPVIEDVL
jgi:hypothetical protein